MTTIPDLCLQYTAVFQTLRLEIGITMIAGVLLGIAIGRLYK